MAALSEGSPAVVMAIIRPGRFIVLFMKGRRAALYLVLLAKDSSTFTP